MRGINSQADDGFALFRVSHNTNKTNQHPQMLKLQYSFGKR